MAVSMLIGWWIYIGWLQCFKPNPIVISRSFIITEIKVSTTSPQAQTQDRQESYRRKARRSEIVLPSLNFVKHTSTIVQCLLDHREQIPDAHVCLNLILGTWP